MPQLRVEYAKSGRAKCALSGCGTTIAKHEVRIGTSFVFPTGAEPSEEDPVAYKWRHLCCFTERQVRNAEESGDLAAIDGIDQLAPADRALVHAMTRGELVGKDTLKGRVGDVANSPMADTLLPKKSPKGKKTAPRQKATSTETDTTTPTKGNATTKTPKKGAKRGRDVVMEDRADAQSDATEEYVVDVITVRGRPMCPYGEKCFRTNAEHFTQYAHSEAEKNADSNTATQTRKVAVLNGKKTTAQHEKDE